MRKEKSGTVDQFFRNFGIIRIKKPKYTQFREFQPNNRHHSLARRDSLCNTGDTQAGIAYQIFDFVVHKNTMWQITGMEER